MRLAYACVIFVLLAGCSSGGAEEPTVPRSDHPDEPGDPGSGEPGNASSARLYLRNPDALGFRAPGLRILNFTNNATTRLSNALLTGTGNTMNWILAVPSLALLNATKGCAGAEPSWRIKHYASGIDTLTNQPFAPGNWSLIVRAEKLSNLTLLFNTTTLANYRVMNGTPLSWPVQTLDADPKIESNNSPYRVTFNKTFQTVNRTWVIGHFGVRGDGFAQFREIRSKIEGSAGYLCGEHRNEVPQPVTGGTLWNSLVVVQLGSGGGYSFAGRFESTTAVNARPSARADVLFLS